MLESVLIKLYFFVAKPVVFQWYWTKDRTQWSVYSALCSALFFHAGTLALGSFLLAAVKVLRVLLQFLENRVKKLNSKWSR